MKGSHRRRAPALLAAALLLLLCQPQPGLCQQQQGRDAGRNGPNGPEAPGSPTPAGGENSTASSPAPAPAAPALSPLAQPSPPPQVPPSPAADGSPASPSPARQVEPPGVSVSITLPIGCTVNDTAAGDVCSLLYLTTGFPDAAAMANWTAGSADACGWSGITCYQGSTRVQAV